MDKGFTLIELIGTVVILAVISLIAFPAITNLLNSSNQTIDEKTEEFIESAALSYVNEHKDDFPRESTKNITVKDLVDNGYLATSVLCDNCELANDILSVKFTTKYEISYEKKDGGTCPTNCE